MLVLYEVREYQVSRLYNLHELGSLVLKTLYVS